MTVNAPDKFDLCVIGCGPGGFAAAMSALDLGRHVCIVEAGEIGGTGVMWGALASKTMWELAKDFAIAAKVDRGYRAGDLRVDYPALRNTVLQAVKEKQYQMLSQIETFSPGRWPGAGSLTLKRGRGTLRSATSLAVAYPDGRREELRADFFLIATGSRPRDFPNIRTDQTRIINSDGVLNLKAFPRRLMIIGAGITGCEYATIFSNFGQTKLYLVDHQERVVPFEDTDVSAFVNASLEKRGVEIFHAAMLRRIQTGPDHLEVTLDFSDGHAEIVEVDTVLISIGRNPNLAGLNLELFGIRPNVRGFLETDAYCRVKDNIYAAGDVTPHPALVNMAEMEARTAVHNMFDSPRQAFNYHNMTTIMFFDPAVAAVGLNEKACQKNRIPYRVAYYAISLLSRAMAMRALDGFVKIIISDDGQQKILGMRAAGPQASSTIMSIALLMDQGKGLKDVVNSFYPHPTMSEGIQECLRLLLGTSTFKSRAFPRQIHIRAWHPERGYFSGPAVDPYSP